MSCDRETGLRQEVASTYAALGALGMITGSSGNVSARVPGGMVITPSGTTAAQVSPDTLVRMGLDAPSPGASSEWALHAAIYRQVPTAGAVVHTHADACTALACLNQSLPAFHYDLAGFGGPVRCAPYATFGTEELATLAAEAMRDRSACLLANHGMVVHAPDCAKALAAAIRLEALCRQYLLARSAGEPRLLTDAELAAAQARYRNYGAAGGSASPQPERTG